MSGGRNYCRDCGRQVSTESLTDLCPPCFSAPAAPVDVLAVMDSRIRSESKFDGYAAKAAVAELHQARAAVAELVEAHRSLLKLVGDNADNIAVYAGVHPDTLNAECDRSSAALAKFGGAA